MLVRALILSLLLSGTAFAQEENKGDDTLKKAGNIATQPVRDVGFDKAKIPPILEKSTEAPYAMPRGGTCRAIGAELAELTKAIGPDFGSGTANNTNRTGQIMEAGGTAVVNALIPFRGLVREVSGAAPAERRLNAAITTGIARRGFLRGVAQVKGCKLD